MGESQDENRQGNREEDWRWEEFWALSRGDRESEEIPSDLESLVLYSICYQVMERRGCRLVESPGRFEEELQAIHLN